MLSRGPQNEQTLEQARQFLAEYRPSMVAIFKRQAKIGAAMSREVGVTVEELVELYILLVSATGFLDVSSNGLIVPSSKLTRLYSMKRSGIRENLKS